MRIKVLSLNLWEGGHLFDNILALFKAEQPDILLLQEAYNGADESWPVNLRTLEVLQAQLGGYESFFSAELLHARKEGKIDVGNAVFSRYPIVSRKTVFFDVPYGEYAEDTDKVDFSRDPKNIQLVVIQAGTARINVGNLHGIWGFDGNDNPRRLRMSRTITDLVKGKENVILAGDFNVEAGTQTIANIEQELKNVFKGQLQTSFNLKYKTKGNYATSVVDMMFVSENINIIENYCPDIDVSDHRPLVAVLQIGS